ncbi:ABC transporter permease [Amycolatopsis magusensis]|uniref:Osmoprotectant transport system permease protein n=1 Tax=Amycolatopsis magusensis TaxID=882444 RepID=A0ABS4PJP8_9PSEU|nr:ABC transporter permease [Amycolatopsis magusensis]MBP2179647.1 osmoprotectant transport system permease protein [Amycolatopsis magusensis]MDI5981914.1 ABC transporter permease [Amycolatopsis magusensis]
MTTAQTDTSGFTTESGSARAERVRLFAQPLVVVVVVGAVLAWVFSSELKPNELKTLNASTLLSTLGQHLLITVVVTAMVVVIAVPLGVALTRRWAKPAAPVFLAIANIGQAAPALGVLVLFFLWTGWEGLWVVSIPLAFYSLLPVLRNTMVGLQQVDPALIDAGRGIGMSSSAVLRRIELPLAVPLILAGLRTSLVLAVGTATLAVFVNGGGFGVLIDTGYKLQLNRVIVVGAVLAVGTALIVDWLGAVAEQYLGPKGLR